MNVLETDNWCLLLPPEWWAETEDDVVRIADSDDVGELEITTLRKDQGEVDVAELSDMARAESPEINDWSTTRVGAFSGVTGSFQEDEAHIREWYVAAGPVFLYITYFCDLENAGMDDSAVEDILSTLVVGDTDSSGES